ncbi:Short-chain dehydrogenase/reductase SDR [Sodalis praecaptivus]|uniref:Short-chain dehydrogenase/reductase SDR n=1 Tax=Sodalis praecaptivus TaxID=1239307 RepID=W0HYM3_9GAMM|nr:SDR family oxidoreductase [Sodalis praecaptivus]AHF78864.1 Short-chain dehydrogenase/reductase SDR [Sodalis praecaptivus]
MRFQRKVVVVTGASSGIGAAAVERFAQEGATVVLVSRQLHKLQRVAARLAPDRHMVVQADVADRQAVESMIGQVMGRYARIDVLVNNAGVQIPGTVLQSGLDNWHKVASVNIDGVLACSTLALPHLIASRGCIVNNASVSGLGGDWGGAHYCAAKGAVVNLTRAMALDHAADGVRVNSVCPSLVMTGMTAGFAAETCEKFYQRIPMERAGEASEVASAMAFLASDDASFITGVNLPVDGGVTASDGQPRLPADAF